MPHNFFQKLHIKRLCIVCVLFFCIAVCLASLAQFAVAQRAAEFDIVLAGGRVMDPESGNWNVVTSRRDLGIVEYLCWSPDGSTIYFNRTLDKATGVFSVPFLGGEERLVVENAGNPAALPDGSLLVARPNDDGRAQLTRVWPDTGRMQALPVDVTFDPGFRPWIRVSADGRRVVVALGRMYDTPGKRSLIEVDVEAGPWPRGC